MRIVLKVDSSNIFGGDDAMAIKVAGHEVRRDVHMGRINDD